MLQQYYNQQMTDAQELLGRDLTTDSNNPLMAVEWAATEVSGELTLTDLADIVATPPEEHEFIQYLMDYIEGLHYITLRIEEVKKAEKTIKKRLKYASDLLTKIMSTEAAPLPEERVVNTPVDVMDSVVETASPLIGTLADFSSN